VGRASTTEAGGSCPSYASLGDPCGFIAQVSAFILDELAAGVELMFQQVQRLREASSSLLTVERPLLRGDINLNTEKLLGRSVLPFRMRQWRVWRNWHNHRGRRAEESDIVAETFGLETSDINANASVGSHGQQILRRSVEAHRVALIWNAYNVWRPSSSIASTSAAFTFWSSATPEDRGPTTDRGEVSSCMSTCYTFTPYVLDSTLQRYDSKIRALVEFFVSSMFATIKARCEAVEILFVDKACRSAAYTKQTVSWSKLRSLEPSERVHTDGRFDRDEAASPKQQDESLFTVAVETSVVV
jgi:hypothetical protein